MELFGEESTTTASFIDALPFGIGAAVRRVASPGPYRFNVHDTVRSRTTSKNVADISLFHISYFLFRVHVTG